MFDCNKLIHPFQNDPGVSQRQRIMEDLLDGSAKIDGRTLADLLNYFVELSRHINYYDSTLSLGDWQPFFKKSLPFSVASMARYDQKQVTAKFELYARLFDKKPSVQGLQLLLFYTYYGVIDKINTWYGEVKGSSLPVELAIAKLTRDQLRKPVDEFIGYANCAVRWYCIRPLDISRLRQNDLWDIGDASETLPCETDPFKKQYRTRRQRLFAIKEKISGLFTSFVNVTQAISEVASLTVEDSLLPLKEEFKQNNAPHLALIFAFLKLFRYLQDDLNSYTRKHLDFFYKDVLKLTPRGAKPDHAHLIFEIQNALDQHLLKKGLLAKDGKDSRKEDVHYSLDEEIVVNKAQVADQRTLFLNYETVSEQTYLEGVYMAPDATRADGVKVDFKEGEPKSFATLGAKWSKYTDPETGFIKPHPRARLGFVLASPVLLLNEGKRTIHIDLKCKLTPACAQTRIATGGMAGCCEDQNTQVEEEMMYPELVDAANWYKEIADSINERYYYFDRETIAGNIKKGLDPNLAAKVIKVFLTDSRKLCYCPVETGKYDAAVRASDINAGNDFNADELSSIAFFFKPRKSLRTFYSGEKEWLEPDIPSDIVITPNAFPGPNATFTISITSEFGPDRPAITFYDGAKLKEDLGTSLPLVKIELDDIMKPDGPRQRQTGGCCLDRPDFVKQRKISLYHFFRDIIIVNESVPYIKVDVCGLKNLIVQNDESVQNVSSPILPFGVRPKIDASFYVGNKEVFSKNWQSLWINVTWKDKPANLQTHYQYYDYEPYEDGSNTITEASFKVSTSLLEEGKWKADGQRRLFREPMAASASFCGHPAVLPANQDVYGYLNTAFAGKSYAPRSLDAAELLPLTVNSTYGFLRLSLQGVSFQHDRYAFVLARHMMVLAGLIDPASLVELRARVLEGEQLVNAISGKIDDIILLIPTIEGTLANSLDVLGDILTLLSEILITPSIGDAQTKAGQIVNKIGAIGPPPGSLLSDLNIVSGLLNDIENKLNFDLNPLILDLVGDGVKQIITRLIEVVQKIKEIVDFDASKIGLPREPYTPAISSISLDYTAVALLNDIEFIHLYPYAGTYKREEIQFSPPLFPTHCDEGSLFLGLKNLRPGANLNLLFQLAEATADSEEERKEVNWFYLDSNQWKLLRKGFEVLDDATNGLTTSGIIRLALPANMTLENTVMPKGVHWIKAAIPENSRSVSETIGIHTQAIRVTFTNEERNDKQRLSSPLPKDSISKLYEADAAVKKVSQPYDSFAGRVPEASSHFYVRASELLRHKGRGIQCFDYERLVLEMFPQVYVAKCINHSFALSAHEYFNDFPLAPGYVIVAVIPDLVQLKAAQSFEPRVPVSILEDISRLLKKKISPFVRLRVMNPRYEKVYFGLKVKFFPGKDETYYKTLLILELRKFLAPWAIGEYDKLAFGQCVYRSDIVRFLESRDYLDYILELRMEHEQKILLRNEREGRCPGDEHRVCPLTPRSILVAGEIDVCVVQQDCETWGEGACENQEIRLVDYCKESNF